jgi:alpha-galactosidase
MKADRVLFLGNSICLVPPGPNWPNNWGLTASALDKDYVHLLAKAIEARTGSKLRLVATDPAIKNPDGSIVTGNANIVNIADIFERQYATYSAARLQQQIDWKPDVVVLQFGENIPPQTFDAAVFKKSLKQLVADFQNSGNPNIFMTGYILGSNAVVDDIKRQVCAEDKTHRVFVDLSRVWPDPVTHGEFGHPNDKGMAMVADLLFRAMAAHLTSQPPR